MADTPLSTTWLRGGDPGVVDAAEQGHTKAVHDNIKPWLGVLIGIADYIDEHYPEIAARQPAVGALDAFLAVWVELGPSDRAHFASIVWEELRPNAILDAHVVCGAICRAVTLLREVRGAPAAQLPDDHPRAEVTITMRRSRWEALIAAGATMDLPGPDPSFDPGAAIQAFEMLSITLNGEVS